MMGKELGAARKYGRAEKEMIAAVGATGDATARKLGLSFKEGAQIATEVAVTMQAQNSAFDVPKATSAEVKAWVGQDPIKAQRALDQEQASASPRTTLVTWLQGVLQSQGSH